jgi:hypothetical protein
MVMYRKSKKKKEKGGEVKTKRKIKPKGLNNNKDRKS